MAARPAKQQIEQIRRAARESRTRLSKTAAAHRFTDTPSLSNREIIGELSLLLLTIQHEIAYQEALINVLHKPDGYNAGQANNEANRLSPVS